MTRKYRGRIRIVLLALGLLMFLTVPALGMSKAKCKRTCATIVEQCKKGCDEHVKKPEAKTKCKSGCKKMKKKCLEECPKM